MKPSALIVGVGEGLSASIARLFAREGYDVHMVARNTEKLENLRAETHGSLFRADATNAHAIGSVIDSIQGRLEVAVYNASYRVRGPLTELDPREVQTALHVSGYGSFLLGQAAARRMLRQDGEVKGTILFTGASAGVKGFPESAPFAMGKFAQRGLAQSMARELHPKGIHVAWVNIDGALNNPGRSAATPDGMLEPEAVAEAYLGLARQHRSAWTDEIALRPWTEGY